MSVRIVFLGPLRDIAGTGEMGADAPLDWKALLDAVGPDVAAELRSGRITIACDGQVLTDAAGLVAGEGAEVALLPPVSGG